MILLEWEESYEGQKLGEFEGSSVENFSDTHYVAYL